MYFVSMWLHITCEVNQNIYLLIHFDVKMMKREYAVSHMDKIAPKSTVKKAKTGGQSKWKK